MFFFKVQSHDTFPFRFPKDYIWGLSKSNGQIFPQSDFPFVFYTFLRSFTVLTIWFSPECWMEIGLQLILKRHFDSYFDIRLLSSHDMILLRKWKPDGKSCDCTFTCAVNSSPLPDFQLSFSDWKFWHLLVSTIFIFPTSSEPLHTQSPNLTQMFIYGSCKWEMLLKMGWGYKFTTWKRRTEHSSRHFNPFLEKHSWQF